MDMILFPTDKNYLCGCVWGLKKPTDKKDLHHYYNEFYTCVERGISEINDINLQQHMIEHLNSEKAKHNVS